jgi:hypothetical protein
VTAGKTVTIPAGLVINQINNLTVAGTLIQSNTATQTILGDLTIQSGGSLSHTGNTSSQNYSLNFAAFNIYVNSGGSITGAYAGYSAQTGTGAGGYDTNYGGGGGHGGDGGQHDWSGTKGLKYCNSSNPSTIGSGGGDTWYIGGGTGGGLIKLVATSTVINSGTISVAGGIGGTSATNGGGGGAGGGVNITTRRFINNASSYLYAYGGAGGGSSSLGAGGGGGCVFIRYGFYQNSGTLLYSGGYSSRTGGSGSIGTFVTSSVNTVPTLTQFSVARSDSLVTLSAQLADVNFDATQLKIQYEPGVCNYAGTEATSSIVSASVDNGSATTSTSNYQVQGINTDRYSTVTVNSVWNSLNDIRLSGYYCVYVTPYDGISNGTTVSSLVYIDNGPKAHINKTLTNYVRQALAGWWTFDGKETNATTSTDKSGNSNNATLTNGPVKTIGAIGQALSFDGVDDFLSVPHSDSLNVTSAVTLSAWVKPNSISGTPVLMSKGTGDGYNLSLTSGKPKLILNKAGNTWASIYGSSDWTNLAISDNGLVQVAVNSGRVYRSLDGGISWSSGSIIKTWKDVAISTNGVIQTAVGRHSDNIGSAYIYLSTDSGANWTTVGESKRWHSIAMSGSGKIQLAAQMLYSYEGELYLSTNTGTSWSLINTVPKPYGKVQHGLAMSDSGQVQISLISDGYYISQNQGSSWTSGTGGTNNGNYRGVVMSSDGTKITIVDYGGYIHISTTTGASWVTVANDTPRNWSDVDMSSDGATQVATTDGGEVFVSTDGGLNWSPKDSARGWSCVAMSSDATKMIAAVDGGSIYSSVDRSVTAVNSLANNSWYNVVGTFDGLVGKLYINGVLNTSTTFSTTTAILMDSNTSSLSIGGYTSNYFQGILDDPRIYNYALSAQEIKKLAAAGKGSIVNKTLTNYVVSSLAGWWTFDGKEINTTTSTDKSGNSNNATLTNGPVKTIGKLGQALYFDGTNDFLNIAHSNSLNITSTISMSAWIKPSTGFSSSSTLITKGPLNSGYGLILDTNKPKFILQAIGNIWNLATTTNKVIRKVVMSADGTKQFTVQSSSGYILKSSDSGTTWTFLTGAGSRDWQDIAVSSDGTYVTAVPYDGQIYRSTDGGGFWYAEDISRGRTGVAMSSSGAKQTVVGGGSFMGKVYTSSDYGDNWTERNYSKWWAGVRMSSDGTIQYGIDQSSVYKSTNSGETWSQVFNTSTYLYDLAVSSDGTKITVTQTNSSNIGSIYISSNSGSSWVLRSPTNTAWNSVAMSADGVRQTAVVGVLGRIYISNDSGISWTAVGVSNKNWSGVGMSSDGLKQTAVNTSREIYTSLPNAITSPTSLSANAWTHILTTFTGTTGTIYINGVLNTTTNFGSIAMDSNTSSLGIGGSSTGNYFKGIMDDVRIYNYALSAQEVKKLYTAGK